MTTTVYRPSTSSTGDVSITGDITASGTLNTVGITSAADATAITIDSSENVGIGIATPDGRLHVHTASAGSVTGSPTDLVVENSGNSGISILSPDASFGNIAFGSPTNSGGGLVRWKHSTNVMDLGTNNAGGSLQLKSGAYATGITIDSSQNVGVGIDTPDGRLHVHTSTAGAVAAGVNNDDFIIEVGASGGMSILTPDANAGGIAFGSPSDAFGAFVDWNHDASLMTIGTSKTGAALLMYGGSGQQALQIDDNATSGNTRMLVYDVDNGTLERVTVGAADSGGAGFKVLRIPN